MLFDQVIILQPLIEAMLFQIRIILFYIFLDSLLQNQSGLSRDLLLVKLENHEFEIFPS